MTETPPTIVDCTECNYSRIVAEGDDELPSDVIVDHGRKTGHKLTTKALDEDRDQLVT